MSEASAKVKAVVAEYGRANSRSLIAATTYALTLAEEVDRLEAEVATLTAQRDEALAVLRRHPGEVGAESRIAIAVQALTKEPHG